MKGGRRLVARFKKLSLEQQIFYGVMLVAAAVLCVALAITLYLDVNRQRKSIDDNISNVAAYVSSLDSVVRMVRRGYPDADVKGGLDKLAENFDDLDVLAVYGSDGVRFYHTQRSLGGETYVEGEEKDILNGAEPYITVGYGTQGQQRRAFHAIRSADGAILGYVTASVFMSGVWQQYLGLTLPVLVIFSLSAMVAALLSRGIMDLLVDSLGGRQPRDLLHLYLRQDEVLNAMADGIVATDGEGRVLFSNQTAGRLLGLDGPLAVGATLTELFRESRCVQVAQSGLGSRNRSCMVGDHPVLLSEIPLQGEAGLTGTLSILNDKTEMRRLSDELSGTRYMLDTLRFFNHEFMNKLHIILGYLQTGETRRAMDFIVNSSLVSSQSIRQTADSIRNSRLCALIIGKMMHAAELGILLRLTPDSICREEDMLLKVEDCVTIVGNLLENAIEELSSGDAEVKEIKLSIYCRPDCNLVLCEDTGSGIRPEVRDHIFEKGVSSKGEGRGLGMYMIAQLVEENGGTIEVDSEEQAGTCFTLTFTRPERKD